MEAPIGTINKMRAEIHTRTTVAIRIACVFDAVRTEANDIIMKTIFFIMVQCQPNFPLRPFLCKVSRLRLSTIRQAIQLLARSLTQFCLLPCRKWFRCKPTKLCDRENARLCSTCASYSCRRCNTGCIIVLCSTDPGGGGAGKPGCVGEVAEGGGGGRRQGWTNVGAVAGANVWSIPCGRHWACCWFTLKRC